MYDVLLIIQICSVVITVICVAILGYERNQIQQKLLMITIICAFDYCLGYSVELMSTTYSQATAALKIEYVGASFLVSSYIAFLVKYFKKDHNRFIFAYFLFVDVLTLIGVLRLDVCNWYYKSIGFEYTGLFPHVVIERGPLYYIFFANNVVLIIYGFALVIEAYLKQKNNETYPNAHIRKRTLRLLFVTTCIPFIPYSLGSLGILRYYDLVPLGFLVAAIILLFIVVKDNIFDVVTGAHVQMFSSINDAVIIVNNQMEFLEANKAAVRIFPSLFNYQVEKKCTKEVLAVFDDIDNDFSIEINGRYYERHSSKIYKENVLIGYSVLLIDLTETKELMNQLQDMKNQAEQANKAKSTFLANVSHELRTPLNAVLGYSDLIIQETESQSEENHAYAIRKAADNLLSIINTILDISKIEAGKIDIVKTEYDTMELFTDVINIVSIPAKAKGLELLFDIDPSIPASLYGDNEHIRQVLINLLNNAVKFTDEGSVKLSVHREKGGTGFIDVVYTITDTGKGIKQEDMKKIFERFEKASVNDAGKVEGTGLGLFITKSLVGLMGGNLTVTSEYGKGSTFTMNVAQRICSEKTISGTPLLLKTNEKIKNTIHLYAPKAKVLSVDDNQINNGVFFEFCKKFGFEPKLVDSGAKAVELLQKNQFDLVFLDQMMPEMDGIETLKQIEKITNLDPNMSILAFTANAIRGNMEYLISMGFDDVVLKPIGIKALEEVLEYYLPDNVKEKKLESGNDSEDFYIPTMEEISESDSQTPVMAPDTNASIEEVSAAQVSERKITIDTAIGLSHCNEDEDLYRMTLQMLLDYVPEKLELIKKYRETKNYENYIIEVHALKNNAALIGAMELSEAAKQLEYAGKEGRYEDIEIGTNPLIAGFEQLIQSVKSILSQKHK